MVLQEWVVLQDLVIVLNLVGSVELCVKVRLHQLGGFSTGKCIRQIPAFRLYIP